MRDGVRQHHYRRQSATGFGAWMQCDHCGATQHSGYYWLAGFKSKSEPPCFEGDMQVFGSEWANSAERDGVENWK
jgi:hypothetical protein